MLRNSLFGVGAVTILCCNLSACVATDDSNPPLANAPTAAIGAAHSYAAAKPKTGGPAWSGTSGASGHPAMHAQAIRAAAADFQRCINDLQAPASRRGISRASFIRHTAGLTPDLRLMDLMDSQPEFTKAVWDYLEALVNEERIAKGREMLAAHRATFDAVERAYGVDRHILVAVWGVETKYSAMAGTRPVVRSMATLACIGRRQDYFRGEFFAALEILERNDVKPENLKGSWAGAFGPTQFMPSTYMQFAVDFDRDGHRDMVGSVPDAMASTANYLRRSGWRPGETWGYEVALPRGFDYLLADRARELTIAQWERLGVRRAGGRAFPRSGERAYLAVPAGAKGPAFLMLNNFRVILKYNPAEAYALAIGHLADRLRGGGPFVQPWPRHETVLSRSERHELQERLAARGFEVGEPDGRLGSKTRVALRQFQASAGMTPDGFASGTILTRLRGQ
jgi:lytic murein transglycosylase